MALVKSVNDILPDHIKHTMAHGADVHRNLPKTTENSVIITA